VSRVALVGFGLAGQSFHARLISGSEALDAAPRSGEQRAVVELTG
jgi:hypothetical protein